MGLMADRRSSIHLGADCWECLRRSDRFTIDAWGRIRHNRANRTNLAFNLDYLIQRTEFRAADRLSGFLTQDVRVHSSTLQAIPLHSAPGSEALPNKTQWKARMREELFRHPFVETSERIVQSCGKFSHPFGKFSHTAGNIHY
jgi:hypothetical protein